MFFFRYFVCVYRIGLAMLSRLARSRCWAFPIMCSQGMRQACNFICEMSVAHSICYAVCAQHCN